ncbi:SDR family NAD(P)-dependent oxidoreductase [Paenibacillus solisilvae]|uniref:SDR family NAD(P)-dependent oxidoreductase n=1 Tax=Paenibacillus solisilvae TaxID=2486751 RepID=A0ABW0VWL7_9BACL
MLTYDGKIVLITGASGGIGSHLARAYAKEGARVVLVDKRTSNGQAIAEEIADEGGHAQFFATDLGSPDQIEQLFKWIQQEYGTLHILINNAGFGIWKSPYELTVEEWDHVLNVNLRGTFLCSREAAKRMRVTGGGRIVNISSTRARMSEPSGEAYAASKGGITAITHALAVSLGQDGITVNCISPGWIENGDYGELRQIDHDQHPAGRVGRPDDVVRACMYLTAPDNDFVTGADIVVDGGMTRKMIYEH